MQASPVYFKIHGEGTGSKAGELIRKTGPILESGFCLHKRHVFGMSVCFDFFRRCGALDALAQGKSHEEVCKLVENGKFSASEMKIIEEICRDFCDHKALVVRSSANGDARGTGVYSSFYCMNTPENAGNFIKKVMASHFSQKAIGFRQGAKLEDGIAVMIEPMVVEPGLKGGWSHYGEDGYAQVFAPLASGYGYTTSIAGATVGAVRGLASEYVKNPLLGIVIKEKYAHGMSQLLAEPRLMKHEGTSFKEGIEGFSGNVMFLSSETGMLEKNDVNKKVLSGDILMLLRHTQKLHERSACRQYFEWAMNTKGYPDHYINQIADAPLLKIDVKIDENSEKFLGKAEFVLGQGEVRSSTMIRITHKGAWEWLDSVAQRYEEYSIMFSSASVGIEIFDRVNFDTLRKATAIIQEDGGNASRFDYIGSHVGGMLTAMDKILLSCKEVKTDKMTLENRATDRAGVYRVPLKITASELEQRAVIELDD